MKIDVLVPGVFWRSPPGSIAVRRHRRGIPRCALISCGARKGPIIPLILDCIWDWFPLPTQLLVCSGLNFDITRPKHCGSCQRPHYQIAVAPSFKESWPGLVIRYIMVDERQDPNKTKSCPNRNDKLVLEMIVFISLSKTTKFLLLNWEINRVYEAVKRLSYSISNWKFGKVNKGAAQKRLSF